MNWYAKMRQGAQGELVACADLMKKGFEVFLAIGNFESFDLVAHRHGILLRVQVKTGARERTPITPGKQDIVAWVDVWTNRVEYEPHLPRKPLPEGLVTLFEDGDYRVLGHDFSEQEAMEAAREMIALRRAAEAGK